jgi:hypothetical protein
MVVRLLVGAASLALVLTGCSHRRPEACTVACGADDACPEDMTCAADGYCHGDDDPLTCSGRPPADGAPGTDAGGGDGDGDPCDGAPDHVGDADATDVAIPDGDTIGIDRTLRLDASCLTVESVEVRVEIMHAYRGDIELRLTSPAGDTDVLLASSDDSGQDIAATFASTLAEGESADGAWVLNVRDVYQTDAGTLQYWSIGINQPAP